MHYKSEEQIIYEELLSKLFSIGFAYKVNKPLHNILKEYIFKAYSRGYETGHEDGWEACNEEGY